MLCPREDEAAPKRRLRSSNAFANSSPQLSKSFPKPYAKPSQEPQHSPRRTQNTQGSQETPQRQPGALQGCQRSPPKASKRASKSLPKSFQMLPNPSPNPPKPCQPPPKSSQNRSRRLLGAYLGSMLKKSWLLNVQKTAKKGPRAPKRRHRRSQTPPKWSPRHSQSQFLGDFLASISPLQNCIVFKSIFRGFVIKDLGVETLKIVVFPK